MTDPTLATKADLADAKSSLVQWIVGTMLAAAALAATIAVGVVKLLPQPAPQIVVVPQQSVVQPISPPAPQSPPTTKPGR